MNSNEGSVEDKLLSLIQSPQITSEALVEVKEVVKLIMVLSPVVVNKVHGLVMSNALNCLPDLRGGFQSSVAYFVDSLPRELYCQVLVDLAAAPSLENFNWLKHALASENVLTYVEWERLLFKPMLSDWSTFTNLVSELAEAQKTKLMEIVSHFQDPNSNSTNDGQQKWLEGLGKAPTMPKIKKEPCLQPQPNPHEGDPLDTITIDDDDDDESARQDDLRVKVETMCSFLVPSPSSASDIKPKVKPNVEDVKPDAEAKVYLIPGSRKVTPGGSVIQVFQRSEKRKRKSGSKLPSKHPPLSEGSAIDAAADKGSIVAPTSSEDESTGAKRQRSHDVSDPAANLTRSREKQTTPLSSASPSGESTPSQLQNDWEKGRSPVFSQPDYSLDPGRNDTVPGGKLNLSDDTSGIGSRSVSPRDIISPYSTLGHPVKKEDDDEDSQSGNDPAVVYDECFICSESIPRMMDNPLSSMIHHMAQEHDDIPAGSSTSSPNGDVRCRRCRLFFQDLFIKDLHEKKACQAPECEGCKLSLSQSETMRLLHLASTHGDIPPGCPTRIPLSGEQCPFCRLWFQAAILKFHVKECVKTTNLL